MPDFSKRSAGQKLSLSANELNGMLDAAVAHKQRQSQPSVVPKSPSHRQLLVQNKTGETVERHRILKLGQPVVLPEAGDADATNEYRNKVVLEGDMPDDESAGLWCVIQKDANDDEIVPAMVLGITPCWINLTDETHTHVEAADGEVVPESATSGSARIVWIAGGVGMATETGEQWATIIVDSGGATTRARTVRCVDDYDHDQEYVSVRTLIDGTLEGEPYDVQITVHTTLDDVFVVVPIDGEYDWCQLGLPTQREQHMVLQILDEPGNAQAIDWDFPKGHD